MRQLWHAAEMPKGARGVGERCRRPETTGNLYGRMLDISRAGGVGRRWENVDVLYGEMANFSDHLLGVGGVDLAWFDSAGVCC